MYLCKIHKLKKWAMRVISNSHYRSHTASIFQKYNILNVYDSYKLEVGVFMYQYFQNLLPSSFNTFFSKRSDIHDYHTRIRVISIKLEIKRSLLIKQSGLQVQLHGIQLMIKLKKQFQLTIFGNLLNHY